MERLDLARGAVEEADETTGQASIELYLSAVAHALIVLAEQSQNVADDTRAIKAHLEQASGGPWVVPA